MRALDDVRGTVEKALSTVPGTFLEEKGMTLTVHLRKVKRGELPVAAHAVSEATRPYRMRGESCCVRARRPSKYSPSVEWDKGKTVLWLLEKGPVAGGEAPWPVCVGDDRTDEDAFRTLREQGTDSIRGGAPENRSPILSQKHRGGSGISREARKDQKGVTTWRNWREQLNLSGSIHACI